MFGKKKNSADEIIKQQEKRQLVEEKYKPLLKMHFGLMERYEKAYSTALKTGIDSRLMESVVQMAKEDIALSSGIKDYCEAIGDPLYTLPAYKRLVIIFEKQKKYDEAIDICEASIRIGNHPDEFRERKSKLLEKKRRAKNE